MQDKKSSISDHYKILVEKVVKEWDGQDTADLILEILEATGEETSAVLESVRYRYRHQLQKRFYEITKKDCNQQDPG